VRVARERHHIPVFFAPERQVGDALLRLARVECADAGCRNAALADARVGALATVGEATVDVDEAGLAARHLTEVRRAARARDVIGRAGRAIRRRAAAPRSRRHAGARRRARRRSGRALAGARGPADAGLAADAADPEAIRVRAALAVGDAAVTDRTEVR